MKRNIARVLAPLGAALALLVVLAFGLQMTVRAETSVISETCPWHGQLDAPNPTWESWGGSYYVNGLPGPAGSEIEMRNTLGQPVSCYRTSIPGGWGVTRVTNGSTGFYPGEPLSMFVDGVPAQPGGYYYKGDKLGHSMTVTLDIPEFSLTLDPPFISESVGPGDFKMIEVTVTNSSAYPAYFSSAAAADWNWNNTCVWPTASTQDVLKPNESMVLLFSVNGMSCTANGGYNSALVFAETHPVKPGAPMSLTLPIQVAVAAAEVTPTATPMPPTATPVSPTATPVSPTATPVSPTATPAEWQVQVKAPGTVEGGQQVNFSIVITNAGWENQLGKVEMFMSLSPFKLIPNVGISTGSLVGVSMSDKLIKYTWDFELLPGTSSTLTSIGTAVEVASPWLYEGVWSFTGPGANDGATVSLLVKPQAPVDPTATPMSPTPTLGAPTATPTATPVSHTPTPTATPMSPTPTLGAPTATPTATPTSTPMPPPVSWSINVDSPVEVDSGGDVTFTMQVKNTGMASQYGTVKLVVQLDPFADEPQTSVSPGGILAVETSDVQTNTWTFLLEPGGTVALASTGKAVTTEVATVFHSAWSWQGPTSDGSMDITIKAEEQSPLIKVFLPWVNR